MKSLNIIDIFAFKSVATKEHSPISRVNYHLFQGGWCFFLDLCGMNVNGNSRSINHRHRNTNDFRIYFFGIFITWTENSMEHFHSHEKISTRSEFLHDFYHPPILQQIIVSHFFFSEFFSITFFIWNFFLHLFPFVCCTPSWPFFPTVNHINSGRIRVPSTECMHYVWWWHISNSSNVACSRIHLGTMAQMNEWITATWLCAEGRPGMKWMGLRVRERERRSAKKFKPFKVKWFNLNMRKISVGISFNFNHLLPAHSHTCAHYLLSRITIMTLNSAAPFLSLPEALFSHHFPNAFFHTHFVLTPKNTCSWYYQRDRMLYNKYIQRVCER